MKPSEWEKCPDLTTRDSARWSAPFRSIRTGRSNNRRTAPKRCPRPVGPPTTLNSATPRQSSSPIARTDPRNQP